MTLQQRIGRNIYLFRKSRGYSQLKLSDELKISTSYLSQLENGDANPTVGKLEQLTHALYTSVEEIMKEPDELWGEPRKFRYRYKTTSILLIGQDSNEVLFYGIRCEEKKYDTWYTLSHITDISTDREMVTRLTEKMNKQEIAPIHLHDVVIDALSY